MKFETDCADYFEFESWEYFEQVVWYIFEAFFACKGPWEAVQFNCIFILEGIDCWSRVKVFAS